MTRHIGIILFVGAICVVLGSILFPVLGQPKEAAKASSALSQWKQRALVAESQLDDAPLHTAARQAGADRSVSRQASLGVDVDNLEKAEKKMKDSITAHGGYIDHETGEDLASEQPVMRLTIRVPEKSFEQVLTSFEELGHRTQKTISASDLTERILNAEARLKQAEGTTKPRLAGGYDPSIEPTKPIRAERDELAAQAAMSSIDLTLQQKPNADSSVAASASWGSDTWNAALSSAMGAFRVVGAICIWGLVYSPLWLTPCLVAFAIRKHVRRSKMAM